MSLKKKIKKFIRNSGNNDSMLNRCYQSAVERKRQKRYEKFTDVPVDEKLVIFEAFMGRKYTDSPKAIYENMLSREEFNDFRFIWCFRDSVMADFAQVRDNERTTLVRWGSEDYYREYARAAYWFTNTRIPGAIGKRDGQTYTQCWHGTPLKRLGCDIESEATESKETTRSVIHGDVKRYDYLVSPSGFFTEKMSSAFDLKALDKEDIVIETGYPRNDALFGCGEEDKAEMRCRLGIPESKKVILYAPTYRENNRDKDRKYRYSEPLDFNKLKDVIGDEYVVLFRAHYFIAQGFDFDRHDGFVIDVSSYEEINDLYIASDLLITDYSSVFFDYSVLKRPVIFYMHDLEFYRDELRGFYLDIGELPGPVAKTQEELEHTILTLEDWSNRPDYAKTQSEFIKRFAPYEDGHSTERVIKKVTGK